MSLASLMGDLCPDAGLEAGEHLITMKVFEGGGGHNGGLMIQDDLGNPAPGVIVVRDFDAACLRIVGSINTDHIMLVVYLLSIFSPPLRVTA